MELQDCSKSGHDDDGQKGNHQSSSKLSSSTVPSSSSIQTRRRIPQMHLVITNISKRPNIRALLLNAAAFKCQSVIMVGQRNFDTIADMPGPLKDHYVVVESSRKQQLQLQLHADDDDSSHSSSLPPTSTTTTTDPTKATTAANNNSRKLVIIRFDKWNECCDYMIKNKIRLVGVEIHQNAMSIQEFLHQYNSSTSSPNNENNTNNDVAFIMGNEGQGIHTKHMRSCDAFIRISQYGVGTASLNVYVAASLILHRFHQWQLQEEEEEEQQKQQQQLE